jgi:hypothetical protein
VGGGSGCGKGKVERGKQGTRQFDLGEGHLDGCGYGQGPGGWWSGQAFRTVQTIPGSLFEKHFQYCKSVCIRLLNS